MPVLTRRHGDVAEITLDWPEKRNALGPVEAHELRLAIECATADQSVATLVLSANGRAFCGGGNLPEIVRLAGAGPDAVRTTIYGEFQGVFRAIVDSPVPVITAVDGAAVGFGCDLALVGHATFVGANGWLAQGWAKAGLIPATGGMMFATKRGGSQAVWRLLAADRVDGPTAQSWQLAISVPDARQAALAMAASFAALPGGAVRAMVRLASLTDREAHLKQALDDQVGLITSPEFASLAQALLRR